MNLRVLFYFTTLAREGHFARAATKCGVTQPTLSLALLSLEDALGKRLIQRDRRYIGLTPEGQAMLPWAQQILAAYDGMMQSAQIVSGHLQGELKLGVIPAALPTVGEFSSLFLRSSPAVSVSVISLTSAEIFIGLNAFELDAGITYLDRIESLDFIGEPMVPDLHILVTPRRNIGAGSAAISWQEAARQPLCLLHGGMQNRRIIDAVMAHYGVTVCPRATADSFVALLALVKAGDFATIIPESHRFLVEDADWAEIKSLEAIPDENAIGLIVPSRTPMSPLSIAALSTARSLNRAT